jgi:hypothetical protein
VHRRTPPRKQAGDDAILPDGRIIVEIRMLR